MKKTIVAMFLALSSLTLGGCAALSSILPKVVDVMKQVGDAALVLDQIGSFVDQFFAAHPDNATAVEVHKRLSVARKALVVLERAGDASGDLKAGKGASALAAFREAYDSLIDLVNSLGGTMKVERRPGTLTATPGVDVILAPSVLAEGEQ